MRPADRRAPGLRLEASGRLEGWRVEELKEGQRVRMKTCIPGLAWTGRILRREGEKYAVKTDKSHFGTDVHLVEPKDVRALAERT